jgi:Family of unknown function (DUF5335)
MTTQQRHEIPRQEWNWFFEAVTKTHAGHDVIVEVLDREFGDGREAQGLPLAYIEYDDNDDEIAVAVGGRDGRFPVMLRHAVPRPRRILADTALPHIDWAFDIEGDDDSHTIVTVSAP